MNLSSRSQAFFTCFSTATGLCLAAIPTRASDWPQWRGPARDGVSQEKGLLKEWPKDGPKQLWKVSDAGTGYATPAVVGDRIYLLGSDGFDNETVRALSAADGKQQWATRLGKVGNTNQQPNFPSARSTPTVTGDLLYALGSDGDLACVETKTGHVVWRKSLRTDFGGKPGTWAYSESPLVDGDVVVVTPGGSDATIVALDRKTGDLVWKAPLPDGDDAAYSSAIVVESGGTKQYIQFLQKGLVGLDAKTGKLLWRNTKVVSRYGANIPTPVAGEGLIYAAGAGTGGGALKLKSKDGGVDVEQVYFDTKLPTAIGGVVKIGNYLYGTTAKSLQCIEFATGKLKWEDPALGAASLCYADGLLYLHGEDGEVAVVEPSAEAYREKGRFSPPEQPKKAGPMEKAWAYPVVANGRLLIRDHGSLWCYDVRESAGLK